MMSQLFVLSALLMLTTTTDAAKILGIFPLPSKSHVISFSSLLAGLANRGHEVTVITMFPVDPPVKNIIIQGDTSMDRVAGLDKESSLLDSLQLMIHMGTKLCEKTVQQPQIQELITSQDKHFDLILFETIGSECFFGLVHKFQAPHIAMFPNNWDAAFGDTVGNVYALSYVPSLFLGSIDRMTLTDRLLNTLVASVINAMHQFILLPYQERAMKKYFNDSSIPRLSDMMKNASLLILNSHFSQHYPRPYTPNTIEAGGMHIRPAKKLPKDLQKFLDEAPDGVIYFSMGSNIRSSNMPNELRDAFLGAFAKLKQKILWKWETETLPGQPANVKLGKWLPQNDVLAHPNVRVFITHGGLLSSQEAIYHGVPLLAIPVFGDQKTNAVNAQRKGYAVMLEIANVTADSLSWALRELLKNTRYRDNAKRMSALIRDQPESPLERAVYWTEYVIRHKGAHHLRSAALDLWWFQYYLLDVLALLLGVVISGAFILFLTCRTVYRLLVSKKPAKKSAKHSKAKKRN